MREKRDSDLVWYTSSCCAFSASCGEKNWEIVGITTFCKVPFKLDPWSTGEFSSARNILYESLSVAFHDVRQFLQNLNCFPDDRGISPWKMKPYTVLPKKISSVCEQERAV